MNKVSVHGESPFGMNRKYRRALYSSVRKGNANDQEIERFKSLGKDAYPWLGFRDVIDGMIKGSLATSKHTKSHKNLNSKAE